MDMIDVLKLTVSRLTLIVNSKYRLIIWKHFFPKQLCFGLSTVDLDYVTNIHIRRTSEKNVSQ